MRNSFYQPSVSYSLLNRFFEEPEKPQIFREEETEYQSHFHFPGIKKEAVAVVIHEDTIKVSAQSPEDALVTINYDRTFYLPEDVVIDNLVAKLEDGILTVTVPKQEVVEAPERVIAIT